MRYDDEEYSVLINNQQSTSNFFRVSATGGAGLTTPIGARFCVVESLASDKTKCLMSDTILPSYGRSGPSFTKLFPVLDDTKRYDIIMLYGATERVRASILPTNINHVISLDDPVRIVIFCFLF